jgi:hypothetical protein
MVLSSCGRRAVPVHDPMYAQPGFFQHGFFYGNHFYDPRFYNFIPRGNRIIIVDNRTNQQVASPRRGQIREAQRSDVRGQQQQPRVETDGNRQTQRERNVDTRRRQQTTPERTRRGNVDAQRNQRSQQPRTSPAPSQRRTTPAPSQPQQRGTTGQSPRGSRRGG